MVSSAAPSRIASLDQFRGYTVLGMFFVNFVGHFQAMPAIFKHHHTYCSYADTIMPQFFFAVGFAYRLTFLRRLETAGPRAAYLRALRRSLGLILLGVVVHHLDGGTKTWAELQALGLWGFLCTAFQRNVFQTLVHIGVTSLWVLPVIAARPWVRVGFAIGSSLLHLLLSHAFYYDWVMNRPGIDGGPLGFLTWTIPLLVGTLAYDMIKNNDERGMMNDEWKDRRSSFIVHSSSFSDSLRLLIWGIFLMSLGYLLSCLNLATPPAHLPIGPGPSALGSPASSGWLIEPPFVPPTRPINMWTMSQRAGSISYLAFGAGFSLALYALFVCACDACGFRIGMFVTLGGNALAGYIIHDMVADAIKPYTPKDAPLGFTLAAFAVFLAICYLFIRYLEKNKLYLRL